MQAEESAERLRAQRRSNAWRFAITLIVAGAVLVAIVVVVTTRPNGWSALKVEQPLMAQRLREYCRVAQRWDAPVQQNGAKPRLRFLGAYLLDVRPFNLVPDRQGNVEGIDRASLDGLCAHEHVERGVFFSLFAQLQAVNDGEHAADLNYEAVRRALGGLRRLEYLIVLDAGASGVALEHGLDAGAIGGKAALFRLADGAKLTEVAVVFDAPARHGTSPVDSQTNLAFASAVAQTIGGMGFDIRRP